MEPLGLWQYIEKIDRLRRAALVLILGGQSMGRNLVAGFIILGLALGVIWQLVPQTASDGTEDQSTAAAPLAGTAPVVSALPDEDIVVTETDGAESVVVAPMPQPSPSDATAEPNVEPPTETATADATTAETIPVPATPTPEPAAPRSEEAASSQEEQATETPQETQPTQTTLGTQDTARAEEAPSVETDVAQAPVEVVPTETEMAEDTTAPAETDAADAGAVEESQSAEAVQPAGTPAPSATASTPSSSTADTAEVAENSTAEAAATDLDTANVEADQPEAVSTDGTQTAGATQTTEVPQDSATSSLAVIDAPEADDSATDATTSLAPLEMDIVRVEPDGNTLVAGRAEAGSRVAVMLDGLVAATATASGSGEFVAFFLSEATGVPQELRLMSRGVDGATRMSEESVIIVVEPPETAMAEAAEEPATEEAMADAGTVETETVSADQAEEAPAAAPAQAPLVVRNSDAGVTVLSGTETSAPEQVAFESVSYSITGAVVVTGQGEPSARLVLYVDDTPIGQGNVRGDGRWRVILGELEEGIYTLRVDQFDQFDQITARAETPFQRVFPEIAAAAAQAQANTATESNTAPEAGATPDADAETADVASPEASSAQPVAQASPAAPQPAQIVVQPGDNLWTIARVELGAGIEYIQIFEANADQIRDPDLIYPGQVFSLGTSE